MGLFNSPFIFAWLGRFEPSHATVRWTVAHRRLDGDGSIVFRISSSPPKTNWLGRFEPSHATVRWTVAHRRLDGDGSIVFRISSSPPKTKRTREGVLHFFLAGEIRTIPCNGPVDRCPWPAGRRWLHSVSNLFNSTKNEAHPGGCASACQKSLAEFGGVSCQIKSNHFLSGRVPDRKYISGCKCASCSP